VDLTNPMLRYFAYGSNMNCALMRRQCPGAEPIGPARLDGWRFVVMRGGYASVVPAAGGVVHGVLWRLTPRDVAVLNVFESIDSGLYLRRVLPVRHARRLQPALIYVSPTRARGRPRPGYQAFVVASARAWKFPQTYVRSLERWAPSGFAGRWRLGSGTE
jgi:cation transport regulator ChaC